ncbi:hypothetical protein FQN54_001508 [Arachnomyces sp. PD_36]|nr:hypothetical protein FQN54_001508 [Arachnomyces sp. PD_36]
MHLILTGATGLVGTSVLDAMLKTASITKISILSRKPVPMAENAKDPRVNVIIHKQFETYEPELLDKLKDADACVWALGTSVTNVSKEQYIKITRDYALSAAEAFSTLKPSNRPFRFIYVSGEGVTQNPGPFTAAFARVKGEAESLLGKLSAKSPELIRADSVRPGFVDPAADEAVRAYVSGPVITGAAAKIGISLLGPPVRYLMKGMHSPTEHLGRFLTDMAMGKVDGKLEGKGTFKSGGGVVVENAGIRRVCGL